MGSDAGQATVEVLAAALLLVVVGAISLQLLVAGYSLTAADGAAEAGALALASGRPVKQAVRDALPGWAADDVEATIHGGEVSVELTPPSLLSGLADRLAVNSSAVARPAE